MSLTLNIEDILKNKKIVKTIEYNYSLLEKTTIIISTNISGKQNKELFSSFEIFDCHPNTFDSFIKTHPPIIYFLVFDRYKPLNTEFEIYNWMKLAKEYFISSTPIINESNEDTESANVLELRDNLIKYYTNMFFVIIVV
jgi:hypothetical protein